jgi:hypothetical protein
MEVLTDDIYIDICTGGGIVCIGKGKRANTRKINAIKIWKAVTLPNGTTDTASCTDTSEPPGSIGSAQI